MGLPLLLAGPILRRVEPALASVWLALRDDCDVTMLVWEGLAESGRTNPLAQSPVTRTLRVGAQLHVVVVTIEIPATAGVSFQPDALYSYDVHIRRKEDINTLHTLESLNMLKRGTFDGFVRLPLGGEPGQLPSFAPPPSQLEDLNLLYGSCRKPGHETPDALALVDDLIFDNDLFVDPRARPHQLFLGGDQVYADDVEALHLLVVAEAAVPLIGTTGSADFPDPLEHLRINQVLVRENEALARDPTPLQGYRVERSDEFETDKALPADRVHFPEGRRLSTTRIDAQFTSVDGKNHVLSLGEFAALYLSVWSPALWGEDVPLAKFAPNADAPLQAQAFGWEDELPPFVSGAAGEGAIVMPPIHFPERIPGSLYVIPRKPPKVLSPFEEQQELRKSFGILQKFHAALPKVQRALANVPTYMILDDHDITDDYFLNPVWRDRVLKQKLGQAILGNGMIAYALFQDWGNKPLDYRSDAKAELLTLIPQLFPASLRSAAVPKGPVRAPFERIAALLGHDTDLVQVGTSEFLPANPPLKWHYRVDGPKHVAAVFDNRTRRSYLSEAGPPGNVSKAALEDQLPHLPLPAGREILIVVAPLQVIGPPVLDEIVAPLAFRVFDAVEAKKPSSELDTSSTSGLRLMTGTNPDAIEAWSFDAKTFEHLMELLEPFRRVVILSGDVHYSSGTLMSYWRGNQTQPARFAQFTASGFKNVMPPYITFVDRSVGFAQQLIRANLGTERLGWDQPLDDLVLFPPGRNEFDLRPTLRSKLGSSPVLLPSWGWPDDNDGGTPDPALTTRLNPASPPDWRWRVMPLIDQRLDSARPAGIRIKELDEADVEAKLGSATFADVLAGYQQVASRHQAALGRLRNARQILFRGNVGRVTFDVHEDGRLDAIHEVITAFRHPSLPPADAKPEPFLVQVASLGPEDEEPPTRLRKKAIEVV